MQITLSANGYQGIKAEVAEIRENGAYVFLNRKGIDLAPRKIFFNWDAIRGGKIEAPAPEVPAHGLTPKGAYNVKAEVDHYADRTFLESGRVNGSIANGKSHVLAYQIVAWDNKDGSMGKPELWIHPTCGTTRAASGGGHYQNHIRLADMITCAKCAKRA